MQWSYRSAIIAVLPLFGMGLVTYALVVHSAQSSTTVFLALLASGMACVVIPFASNLHIPGVLELQINELKSTTKTAVDEAVGNVKDQQERMTTQLQSSLLAVQSQISQLKQHQSQSIVQHVPFDSDLKKLLISLAPKVEQSETAIGGRKEPQRNADLETAQAHRFHTICLMVLDDAFQGRCLTLLKSIAAQPVGEDQLNALATSGGVTSEQLADMEALGLLLPNRNTRHVAVTAAGLRYIEAWDPNRLNMRNPPWGSLRSRLAEIMQAGRFDRTVSIPPHPQQCKVINDL